ncbi:DUF4422 domain-containing protein [uncultured Bifidobacterium sp.]|uniref:DUF4422 domain-containing protein n=1 Tax=uncultured Bifidobacterium sp. TaxID=165187 RepID=UPI002596A558|nr:DUF4422 domain-containing protein [uncultured Bifidobacterium sp.]
MQDRRPTHMYIVSHKDFTPPDADGYTPILAGAANNTASIAVRDDTGDNISALNPEFCELTAQYWVWKNADLGNDNVGFVHYRRYFYTDHRKTQIVPASAFSQDLERHDVILPEPWVLTKTIGTQFAQFHNIDDLKTVRAIVNRRTPEFVPAFDALMDRHDLSCYNMFVMSAARFDAYMTWLFGILDEARATLDVSGYDAYNRRLFGFLSERLLNVWVDAQQLNVKRYPVYMPDETAWKANLRSRVKSLMYLHRI